MSKALLIRDHMIRGARFSAAEVSSWMASEDAEVLGAAFQVLYARDSIEGPVDALQANQFLVRYLVATMRGDTSAAKIFAMQPHLAGHELARLYKHWRASMIADDGNLQRVRAELAAMYMSGDERTKSVVINGTLEHIFESRACRADFAAWKSDEQLSMAFDAALDWGIVHECP